MNVLRHGLSQNIRYFALTNSTKHFLPKLKFSTEVGSKEHFDQLVSKNKVVVFMKGTPDEPRCGFSNAVVQIFRMHGVQYDSYNVLDDEKIRQGIKEYSEWPTIPQVFLSGDFVGGCDILIQMHQSGELVEELSKVGIKSALLQAAEDAENNSKEKR